MIGGTITRNACGRMIFDNTWRGRSPRLNAASRWPLCTDRMAARTYLGDEGGAMVRGPHTVPPAPYHLDAAGDIEARAMRGLRCDRCPRRTAASPAASAGAISAHWKAAPLHAPPERYGKQQSQSNGHKVAARSSATKLGNPGRGHSATLPPGSRMLCRGPGRVCSTATYQKISAQALAYAYQLDEPEREAAYQPLVDSRMIPTASRAAWLRRY